MKITDVVATHLRINNVEDICDGTQDVLIVQVATDEGLTGLGEVVSCSFVARAVIEAPRSGGGRHGLRELVIGLDPMDPETVWAAMEEGSSWYGRRGVAIHAMAGIDVALWDIKSQALGQPLHRTLSQAAGRDVRPYASVLWADTIEETGQLAAELVALGFGAVKFGFGPIGTSLEQDVALVGAARRALGSSRELMVDVGRRWTEEQALERCVTLGPFGVRWIEEPLHPRDLEGYARLTAAVETPIAAGETQETIDGFKAYLEAGVKIIQPDLGRVGLTQALALSALARQYGAACVPHCFGTGINTTASIHWMVATGGDLVEYPMRTNALCRRLVHGVPRIDGGWVRPGTTPGLGIQIDARVAKDFRYDYTPAADAKVS